MQFKPSLYVSRCFFFQLYLQKPILASCPEITTHTPNIFSKLSFSHTLFGFIIAHPFEQVVALNAKKVPNQIQLSSMTTGILDPPVGTPVTPLTDTTPSSVTTDYQNLFFPMTFEEEEDSNVDPPLLDICSTEGLKIDPFIH